MSESLKSMVKSVKEAVTGSPSGETVSAYLVRYLVHLGVTRIFTVPGDFTLPLMRDIEAVADGRLSFVLNTNELNSGYAADGYSRVRGLSVLMVTYSVGSLSAFNAIAGMYCEHIPCLVLVGAPNSNSSADGEIVHHTLGEVNYDYSRRMASEITVKASVITRAVDTPHILHNAVQCALSRRQPVYVEIASNLSSESILPKGVPADPVEPLPSLTTLYQLDGLSDSNTMDAAVKAALRLLTAASRPLILGGSLLRRLHGGPKGAGAGLDPFLTLLQQSGFPFAAMMDAKAIIPESHPSYIGIYTGGMAILPGHPDGGGLVTSIVESADAVLLVGCIQSDYATAGHSMKLPDMAHQIEVFPDYVKVAGHTYHRVLMSDFLHHLVLDTQWKKQSSLLDDFHRRVQHLDKEQRSLSSEVESKVAERRTRYPLTLEPTAALTMRSVHHHLQHWLDSTNAATPTTSTPPPPAHILVDCGDSWMTGMKLRVPSHGTFTAQVHYGSLGFGTPAALGYATGLRDEGKPGRLVLIQGDGGFQMSPQEISAIVRYHTSLIIFLMANQTYLIENEIVEGGYNDLHPWDYVGLIQALAGKGRGGPAVGDAYAVRVETNQEMLRALDEVGRREGLCVVEVAIARDDCNIELTQWAMALHPSASRPPRV